LRLYDANSPLSKGAGGCPNSPYQSGEGDVPQRAEALCCVTYVHCNGTHVGAIHKLPYNM